MQSNIKFAHMFSHSPSNKGCVQKPVMHALVPECNTANMLPSIHIPRSNTHTQLLGNRVLTPAIQHGLFEIKRSYMYTCIDGEKKMTN